jgi:hypothetical protein
MVIGVIRFIRIIRGIRVMRAGETTGDLKLAVKQRAPIPRGLQAECAC